MTYRRGFTPMYRCVRAPAKGSSEPRRYIRLTSDAGWGCMIRVGQMLLATALKRHQAVGGEGTAVCTAGSSSSSEDDAAGTAARGPAESGGLARKGASDSSTSSTCTGADACGS